MAKALTIRQLRKAINIQKGFGPYQLTIMEHFNNAKKKDEQKKKQKAIS